MSDGSTKLKCKDCLELVDASVFLDHRCARKDSLHNCPACGTQMKPVVIFTTIENVCPWCEKFKRAGR